MYLIYSKIQYYHDILFGEGFIGFNTTVDVGVPAEIEALSVYDYGHASFKHDDDHMVFRPSRF